MSDLSEARALAAGQARWDAAEPEPVDHRAKDVEFLRERFTQAMQGDVMQPARWAWFRSHLKTATAADVLMDALIDDPSLARLAMQVIARAATEDGDETACGVIALAARQWAEGALWAKY